jgi:hypothetical protein
MDSTGDRFDSEVFSLEEANQSVNRYKGERLKR